MDVDLQPSRAFEQKFISLKIFGPPGGDDLVAAVFAPSPWRRRSRFADPGTRFGSGRRAHHGPSLSLTRRR
jgi:hypothetical protein